MTCDLEITDYAGHLIKSQTADNISHAIGIILDYIHGQYSSMVIINRSTECVSGFSSCGKFLWRVKI